MAERCLLYYITDRAQFPGDEPSRRRALLEKIAEAARCGVDYIQLREKDLTTRELECLASEAIRVIHEVRPATRLLINSRTDVALAAGADGVHLRAGDISPRDVRGIVEKVTSISKGGPQGLKPTSLGDAGGTAEAVPFPKPDADGTVEAQLNKPKSTSLPIAVAPSPISIRETSSNHYPLSTNHFLVGVSCQSGADVLCAETEGADFAVFAPVFEKKGRPDAVPAGMDALREACKGQIPVLALGGVTLANAAACLKAGAAGIAAIRLFQENRIEEVVRALRAL